MSLYIEVEFKSRLCHYCDTGWPPFEEYMTCPLCREPTEGSKLRDPLPVEEAERRANHAAFGWYCFEHELPGFYEPPCPPVPPKDGP